MKREQIDGITVWREEYSEVLIDREVVFRNMKIFPESPSYEEMLSDYVSVSTELSDKFRLSAAACFSQDILPDSERAVCTGNQQVLFLMETLGELVTIQSDLYFSKREYVKALFCDSISDAVLFRFEQRLLPELETFCREEGRGIAGRITFSDDFLPQMNHQAFLALHADHTLGVKITRAFMFDPVKTNCVIFRVSDRRDDMKLQHNCVSCGKRECAWRTD